MGTLKTILRIIRRYTPCRPCQKKKRGMETKQTLALNRGAYLDSLRGSRTMDRKPYTRSARGKATTVATGVAVRQWQNSTTIRIAFRYKGVECRETLSLPVDKTNIQYAQRLRGEILNAIERGTFDYGTMFPDSKRARLFGHVNANPLIGDLLAQFLAQAERSLQPSTVIGYQRVCNAHLFPTLGKIPVKELTPAYL